MSKPIIFKEDDKEVYLPKHVIIGIGNDNTFTFIDENSNQSINTNDRRSPHEILDNPNGTEFVKIEVKRTNVKSGDTSFQVGQYWYNVVLDRPCTDRIERVTKEWFKGVANFDKIWDKFNIYKNKSGVLDIVIANIKNLISLEDQTSFFKDFKEMKDMQTMDKVEDIQKALIRPFYAVKTIIDMYTGRDDKYGKLVKNYFINDAGRFGFPNINGDKSHIIASLQLIFDISSRCKNCLKNSAIIDPVLKHVRERTFFLEDKKQNDAIEIFERTIKNANYTSFTEPVVFIKSLTQLTEVEYVTLNADPWTRKVVIAIKSVGQDPANQTHDDYKEIGRIHLLPFLKHYIYFDVQKGIIYDDMSAMPKDEVNNLLINADKNFCITLFVKRGLSYREFLQDKFNIKSEDLDLFLNRAYASNIELQTLMPNIEDIDKFMDNNMGTRNIVLNHLITMYLADKSIAQTKEIQKANLTPIQSRFGLCNFNGQLSYFTAAMQLMYESLPLKVQEYNDKLMDDINVSKEALQSTSGEYRIITMIKGVWKRQVNAAQASPEQFLFIHQLLNTEYCLKNMFEYIQTAQIDLVDGKQDTIFENYVKCAYYLTNVAALPVNIGVLANTKFAEDYKYYMPQIFNTNYCYDTMANLAIDVQALAMSRIKANVLINRNYWGNFLIKFYSNLQDQSDPNQYSDPNENKPSSYLQYFKSNEHVSQVETNQIQEALRNNPNGFGLPAIIKNSCVNLLCTLANVMNTKYNAMMWFEDDAKNYIKYDTFVKNNDTKPPNFIVHVNSLPRKPIVNKQRINQQAVDTAKAKLDQSNATKAKTLLDASSNILELTNARNELTNARNELTNAENNLKIAKDAVKATDADLRTNNNQTTPAALTIATTKVNDLTDKVKVLEDRDRSLINDIGLLDKDISSETTILTNATTALDVTMPYSDWAKQVKIEVPGVSFQNNNLNLICGTYSIILRSPPDDIFYRHTENSNIFLKFDTDYFWIIYYKLVEPTSIRNIVLARTSTKGTSTQFSKDWIIRKSDIIEQIVHKLQPEATITEQIKEISWVYPPKSTLEDSLTDDIDTTNNPQLNNASEITFEITELGEIYQPQDGEPKDLSVVFTKKVEDKRRFIHYETGSGKETSSGFTRVGTIYKSIHHNYYYKYFSKSANSVINDAETTPYNPEEDFKDMFPFITLYRSDAYTSIYSSADSTLIYKDTISWYRENEQRIHNLGV